MLLERLRFFQPFLVDTYNSLLDEEWLDPKRKRIYAEAIEKNENELINILFSMDRQYASDMGLLLFPAFLEGAEVISRMLKILEQVESDYLKVAIVHALTKYEPTFVDLSLLSVLGRDIAFLRDLERYITPEWPYTVYSSYVRFCTGLGVSNKELLGTSPVDTLRIIEKIEPLNLYSYQRKYVLSHLKDSNAKKRRRLLEKVLRDPLENFRDVQRIFR